MNTAYPVFTVENECQDCYKCIRHCHCKAIRIVNGKASVIPESCVACGECVRVCPSHAKRIRSDYAALKKMLRNGDRVYASIAPSFTGYFKGVSIEQLSAALRKVGFAGVSETAHGAQRVSAGICRYLDGCDRPLVVSSACPATVDYIRKYHPEYADAITPLPSPLLAHCKLLKETCGEDVRTVFFGPCAAKKNEADRHPDILDAALVFPVLEQLLEEFDVKINHDAATLTLGAAEEGRFYPVEGGMNDTVRDAVSGVRFLTVSGLDNLSRLLRHGFDSVRRSRTIFLEALACRGGCLNGPAMPEDGGGLDVLWRIDGGSKQRSSANRRPCEELRMTVPEKNRRARPEPDEASIARALAKVGKLCKADELNCGACGYNTCRDFARAFLAGKAEEAMCHNYLRKNFQRTSNALIKYIPAAVVIVDEKAEIMECNRNFALLTDSADVYDVLGNLDTVPIKNLMADFAELFNSVLLHGGEIEKYYQQFGNKLINISVFTIAEGKCCGAVIADVTKNELQREQVAQKAREVIRKNVLTVQQVARLFGEHIAETEILLADIAGAYESRTGDRDEG